MDCRFWIGEEGRWRGGCGEWLVANGSSLGMGGGARALNAVQKARSLANPQASAISFRRNGECRSSSLCTACERMFRARRWAPIFSASVRSWVCIGQ
ncbi:MAG: hypothetical protein PHN75_09765 [Syntrophales bacterium]|nr:hypothetical protein [Syntrophales bacterium]